MSWPYQYDHDVRTIGSYARQYRLLTLPNIFAAGYLVSLTLTSSTGTLAALGLVLFGTAMFASQPIISTNHLLRYWYILVIPVFCTISTFWSIFPNISLKAGIQLLASVCFAILVARTIDPRHLRIIVICTLLITALMSLASANFNPYTNALIGIYGSKNALARAAAILIVGAVLMMIDREEGSALRLFAAFAAAVAALVLVLAKSSGTLVLVPMLFLLGGLGYVFSLTSPLSRTVHSIIVALFALFVICLVGFNFSEFSYFVLTFLEKDLTLTGRTVLWTEALNLISERPFFGLGYQAFWVQGFGPAETIWKAFEIEARTGFHFHNLYISNAVEIGLVGVVMQVFLLFGSFAVIFIAAMQQRSSTHMFLALICAMSILQSPIEVPIMTQFNFQTSLTITAFVIGIESLKRRYSRGIR